MKKLYIATTNPGKLRDFAAATTADVSLEPLPGMAAIVPPPEDSPTFEGNARTKAIYYSKYAPGSLVLADDSGLEVDALQGAPGVRSARYAEDSGFLGSTRESIDARNNACLLQALSFQPGTSWPACYRCSLAAAQDGQIIHTADGIVEGEIIPISRGGGGFGYDPLFYLPQYQRTMAELDPTLKFSCSHRGNALRALLAIFPR